jgi:hypothetical protein
MRDARIARGLSTRFGIGMVWIRTSQRGDIADADWADLRGGTSEQVASRFAEAIPVFLPDMREVECSQPPSR